MPRFLIALLSAAAAALVCAPSAIAAAPMKFKADVYIFQGSEWTAGWSNTACGNYEHHYTGKGGTTAIFRQKGIPVTFEGRGGTLGTGEFAMKGSLARTASYQVSESGDPGRCAPGAAMAPAPIDTSSCGLKKVTRPSKSFALIVAGGRLGPVGAFTGNRGRDPFGPSCPDQSLVSAGVDMEPSRERRDVHKLLARKSVRSISLSSGGVIRRPISQDQMGFPAGHDKTGSGEFEGRWTVKLTRVR